jgi:hypothetical protein
VRWPSKNFGVFALFQNDGFATQAKLGDRLFQSHARFIGYEHDSEPIDPLIDADRRDPWAEVREELLDDRLELTVRIVTLDESDW